MNYNDLLPQPNTDSKWLNTRFFGLSIASLKAKGNFGESYYKRLTGATEATSTDHDAILPNGTKIEVKLAMLSVKGTFIINQIRTDQDYDLIALVLVYPEGIDTYHLPKEYAMNRAKPQHKGNAGNSGTFQLVITNRLLVDMRLNGFCIDSEVY